jgi:hypothetical protein
MGIIYNMDTPLLGEKHDGTIPNVQPFQFQLASSSTHPIKIIEDFPLNTVLRSVHEVQNKVDDLTIKLDTLILKSNTTSSYDLLNTLLNKITRLEMKYEDFDKRLSEFEVIVDGNKQEESVEEVDDDATEENTED